PPPGGPDEENEGESSSDSATPALATYNDHRVSISYPSGWTPKYESVSYGQRLSFKSGDPNLLVKVEWSSRSSAGAWGTCEDLSARFEKIAGKTGYSQIRADSYTLGGSDGVWWEFTKLNNGQSCRTIDCFADVGDRGYAVLCRAPVSEFSQWETIFHQVIESFQSH
ncbi:MAG: hypothetical protein ABFD94_05770, partial [Armatimonadia bacterium]